MNVSGKVTPLQDIGALNLCAGGKTVNCGNNQKETQLKDIGNLL